MSIAEFLSTSQKNWVTDFSPMVNDTVKHVCYLFWLNSCLTALFNNEKKQLSKAKNSQ